MSSPSTTSQNKPFSAVGSKRETLTEEASGPGAGFQQEGQTKESYSEWNLPVAFRFSLTL